MDVVVPVSQEEETVAQRSMVPPGPYPTQGTLWLRSPALVPGLSSDHAWSQPALQPLPSHLWPFEIFSSYLPSFSCILFFRLNTKYHFPWSKLFPIHHNSGPKSISLHQVKLPVRCETQMLLFQTLPWRWDLISFLWLRNRLFANYNMDIKSLSFRCHWSEGTRFYCASKQPQPFSGFIKSP